MRIGRTLAVVALATLGLSSCVRMTVDTSFSDSDTISQDIVIAMAPAAAEQIGIDPAQLTADAMREELGGSLPGVDASKVVIEDYVDGDIKGVHVVANDLTIDEFNAASGASAQTSATAGLATPMTVARDGSDWVVTIPADPARDLSDVQGASSLGLIADSIEFGLTFTFPGPVKSATAGDVDGKTVVVGLEDLMTPEEIVIRGSAKDEIAWGPILRWVGIGAVGLGIVALATFLILQDRRRRATNTLPAIPDDVPGAAQANAAAHRPPATASEEQPGS